MGQDVDRTLFSRRDRQTYRSKVQRCLDALTLMLREHPFARDEPMTGVEVELNLVDDDELVPALRGRQVLDAIGGAEFQSELGRWNLELNLPPRPLPGDEWRHFEHQLTDQLGLARAAADSCGARLAVIGILPTIEPRHLVVDALSTEDRYVVLNEQLMSARGEPIRLDIAGDDPSGRHSVAPDHLFADFDSIAPEAACTSMQLHLQVHPDAFAGLLERRAVPGGRAAGGGGELAVPAAVAAVGRDADPAVRAVLRRAHGGAAQPGRAAAGVVRRAVDQLDPRPVQRERPLLPRAAAAHRGHRPDARAQGGPGAAARRAAAAQRHDLALEPPGVRRGGRGAARARREPGAARRADRRRHGGQRPAVLRPAARLLVEAERPLWSSMSFEAAQENFTTAARHGLDGPLYWPGSGWIRPDELVLRKLLPQAADGLARWGVAASVIDRYLTVIERRCLHRRTGAAWQLDAVAALEQRGADRVDGAARHVRPLPGALRGQRAGAHLAAAARRVSGPLTHRTARRERG